MKVVPTLFADTATILLLSSSNKDLQMHRFNLCEKCYDELVKEFVIPVMILDKKEAL